MGDPRSISDDVERTPIQIGASTKAKVSVKNEESKGNMPEVGHTPTGPSNAQKFKAASIDPRSPGGQELTRTPIILKEQADKKILQKTDNNDCEKGEKETKPMRGSAAFVDKLMKSDEVEELLESTSKLEISEKDTLTTSEPRPNDQEITNEEINQLQYLSDDPA